MLVFSTQLCNSVCTLYRKRVYTLHSVCVWGGGLRGSGPLDRLTPAAKSLYS
jgi:hypothetical protein